MNKNEIAKSQSKLVIIRERIEAELVNFGNAMRGITDKVKIMAISYVHALHLNRHIAETVFKEKYGNIISNWGWNVLERIGEGEEPPELFLLQDKCSRMVTQKLDRSTRGSILEGRKEFTVVNPTTMQPQKVKLTEMNSDRFEQVVDASNGKVRDVYEQVKYLSELPKPVAVRWSVKGDSVRISAGVYKANELIAMLNALGVEKFKM